MFCFKCGGSMPDGSTVCPQCGTAVNASAAATPPPAPPAASAGSAWLKAPQEPQQTDGKAVASLVLGILSILLCLSAIAGIPAVILGHISKSNIRNSMGRLKGDGMATAGLIMGYLSFTVMIPVILIIAAIAIPNLLRARIAANEAAAASAVRTVDMAQINYSTTYAPKGYAEDLATLGPGPTGSCPQGGVNGRLGTAEHACLIDNMLGNARCTVGAWCTKGGYRFSMSASCEGEGACMDYVIVATPVAPATGAKSFCSTNDALVRSKSGPPLATPISAEECQSWSVIQ